MVKYIIKFFYKDKLINYINENYTDEEVNAVFTDIYGGEGGLSTTFNFPSINLGVAEINGSVKNNFIPSSDGFVINTDGESVSISNGDGSTVFWGLDETLKLGLKAYESADVEITDGAKLHFESNLSVSTDGVSGEASMNLTVNEGQAGEATYSIAVKPKDLDFDIDIDSSNVAPALAVTAGVVLMGTAIKFPPAAAPGYQLIKAGLGG